MDEDDKKWGKPCHIYAVRCPYCAKPQDFREVGDAILEVEGKARPTVECDHCHGVIEVVRVQPATLIWVRQWSGQAPATQRKQFVILKCPMCQFEVYPNAGGQFFLNGSIVAPGSRCLAAPKGKQCTGAYQRQVLTDDIGERHTVLKSDAVVFKCFACKAEFYGHGFRKNEAGQQLCSCGEPLVRQ
ncbi:MAG: hypothetical protein MUQ56_06250 [Thermoleophilia bacterium]|nr:hypothetical protein [Thermoleophilia bacterium]